MPIETPYTHLRANLASVFEQIIADREIVVVRRRGGDDVALLPADELESLLETAHLLRSPANGRRLLDAYVRSEGDVGKPQTIEQLRRDVGLGRKE